MFKNVNHSRPAFLKKPAAAIVLALLLSMTVQLPALAKFTYSNRMFDDKDFYHTYYLYVNNKEIKTPVMASKETNMVNVVYVPLQAVVTAMGDKYVGEGNEAADTYNFNSAAAINSILRYFMPNEGAVLFNRLQNDRFHLDEPVKYLKDKCTVTVRQTTGPSVIDIAWN